MRFECTKQLPECGSLFCMCGSSFWWSGGLLSLLVLFVLSTASPSFLDFSLLFRGDPAAAAAALFFVTLRIENVLFTVVVVSLKKPKSLNLYSFIYVEFRADSILSQSQLAEACFFFSWRNKEVSRVLMWGCGYCLKLLVMDSCILKALFRIKISLCQLCPTAI